MLSWVPINVLCGLFWVGLIALPLWAITVEYMRNMAYNEQMKQYEEYGDWDLYYFNSKGGE